MKILEFTATGCESDLRQFVGNASWYIDKQTFLDAAWEEFELHEHYEKPSGENVQVEYVCALHEFNEDGEEVAIGYTFCDEKENGAFLAYALCEDELEEIDEQAIRMERV